MQQALRHLKPRPGAKLTAIPPTRLTLKMTLRARPRLPHLKRPAAQELTVLRRVAQLRSVWSRWKTRRRAALKLRRTTVKPRRAVLRLTLKRVALTNRFYSL